MKPAAADVESIVQQIAQLHEQLAELNRRLMVARMEEVAIASHVARYRDEGYLYVIEFGSGLTKIGRTTQPERRFHEHAKSAEKRGDKIVRSWLSRDHPWHCKSETELVRYCVRLGTQIEREYFEGLDFRTACEVAEMCADLAEGEYRKQVDRDRRTYFGQLLKAVDGDLSKTYGEARAALENA